jgi:hypothetical protein
MMRARQRTPQAQGKGDGLEDDYGVLAVVIRGLGRRAQASSASRERCTITRWGSSPGPT